MKIKYLGHSSFKITGQNSFGKPVKVITDPFTKESVGIPYPSQSADIVTLSHHHKDHNNVEGVKAENEKLHIIDTPGEYEITGLRIFGSKSYHDEKQGKERGSNTIFTYDFEEARIAHLGDLGHPLEGDQLEELENVDILMIPVGGFYTIDPEQAMSVIEKLEPSIVIPMHYKTSSHLEPYSKLSTLEDFLKEAGVSVETQDEISIKSKAEFGETMSIVPLSF